MTVNRIISECRARVDVLESKYADARRKYYRASIDAADRGLTEEDMDTDKVYLKQIAVPLERMNAISRELVVLHCLIFEYEKEYGRISGDD